MFDDQLPAHSAPTVPHRALYLRWRPKRFEDVVGQEHVTRTLRNAVKAGRPSHAYLFTGPRGTGKTSVARILYRAANCDNLQDGDPCNECVLCKAALDGRALDLIEIDAASNRGIDDMRDLREKVAYRPGIGRYKVYILDEAHELTAPAWDAFLKTLEEPPPHAIFVLATTDAHKVPATIVSRCQRFDFRRIPFQLIRQQLQHVAASEGMHIQPAVIERLALVARGGLRDAVSLLDQLESFAGGHVDMDMARAALSLPAIEAVRGVLDGMTRRDPSTVMALISDAADSGADLRIFTEELVVSLRALLLLRIGTDVRLTDELPEDEVAWLKERAPVWSVGPLMRLVQTLSEALARTRDAQQFQVQTEVALLTACDVEALPHGLAQPARSAGAAMPATPTAPPPLAEPAASVTPAVIVPACAPPPLELGSIATSEAQPQNSVADITLKGRWADVIDQVKNRNPILASLLGSAHPVAVEDSVLVVAFGTEFNRKSAESKTHRQLIETAFERVYGTAYRLRCTVKTEVDGSINIQDDPVINYAVRTFGGEPRRLALEDSPGNHRPV
ncbi:MAG: DNA polymerase III subunit gamma/tau [Chloroflexota bacterium]